MLKTTWGDDMQPIKNQILVGLCAALMMIFSQISIPLPMGVPMTLQIFGVVLIAIILEAKLATVTLVIYILLGSIGVPVFSNFSSGLFYLAGPTGGFIIGFVIMAFVIGCAYTTGNRTILWGGAYIGLGLDYLLGMVQLALVSHISMEKALLIGVYPFVIKDIISIMAGIIVANRIKLVMRKVGISPIKA